MGSLDKGSLDKAIQNLLIKQIELKNQSTGDNPVIYSNSPSKTVAFSNNIYAVNGAILAGDTIKFYNGLSKLGILKHNNSADRFYTFPDNDITIVGKEIDNQFSYKQTMPQLEIENQGDGDNPVLASNSSEKKLSVIGHLLIGEKIKCMFGTTNECVINAIPTTPRTYTFPDADITVVGKDEGKYYLIDSYPIPVKTSYSLTATSYTLMLDGVSSRPTHANYPSTDVRTEVVITYSCLGEAVGHYFRLDVGGSTRDEKHITNPSSTKNTARLAYDGMPADNSAIQLWGKLDTSGKEIEIYEVMVYIYTKLK